MTSVVIDRAADEQLGDVHGRGSGWPATGPAPHRSHLRAGREAELAVGDHASRPAATPSAMHDRARRARRSTVTAAHLRPCCPASTTKTYVPVLARSAPPAPARPRRRLRSPSVSAHVHELARPEPPLVRSRSVALSAIVPRRAVDAGCR